MKIIFFVVLGIFGASAAPVINSNYQSYRYSNVNGGYGSTLPVINTHIQTPVVENPPIQFPSFPQSTPISDSCHCLKTIVRPQIRNEIISVPSIDRIVRTVATPVVETISYSGGNRMVPAYTSNNVLTTSTRDRNLSGAFQGKTAGRTRGFGGVTGTGYTNCQSSANGAFNGVNIGDFNRAATASINTGTIGTYQNPNAEILPSSASGVFSSSSVFPNGAHIRGY